MWVLYCKTCHSKCYSKNKKNLIKMEEDHQMLHSGVREHPWKITVHDTIIKKEDIIMNKAIVHRETF